MLAPLETVVRPDRPLAFAATMRALRHGPRDPTVHVTADTCRRATRTPSGPATVEYVYDGTEVVVRAWGPGREDALARAPAVLGETDDLTDWEPERHPLIRDLDRRIPGLRLVATGAVLEATLPVVIEQKVTAYEAHRSWARLVWAWGEQAPGPFRLRLAPSASRLARAPYFTFHKFGLERRRADVLRRLADRADRVEEACILPASERRARLEAFPGVGVWTSAEVAQVAWGDADAVTVGDYHLPSIVVYAFTGKRGGDDDAMLELLEPLRPHRARAARLIASSGQRPPRRAPRARLRDIAAC